MNIFQQGDLILKRITAVPEGALLAKHAVLQFGVATKHSHAFDTGKASVFTTGYEVAEDSRLIDTLRHKKFVVLQESAVLRHTNDHHPQIIPPGTYEVDIVREIDYNTRAVRRVED